MRPKPAKNPAASLQVTLERNVYRAIRRVKPLSVALLTILAANSLPAQAETEMQRAMLNAQQINRELHAVYPDIISDFAAQLLNDPKRPRVAPKQPVWVIDTVSGTILYYQGQPSFVGQPAAQLVDDKGNRFGLTALERGRKSRSGWLTLNLGNTEYRAYCETQQPTVVCSLVIADQPAPF